MAVRELISPAEYARRRQVTRAAVSRAILRCSIPLEAGKLDPAVADVLWKLRTDPDQQARAMGQNRAQASEPPPATSMPYDDARRRREAAEAERAEIELARLKGALVSRDDQEREGRALASGIVLQLEAIPDRIAAEFGVDDSHRRRIRQRVREELDRIRDAFAGAGLVEPGNA